MAKTNKKDNITSSNLEGKSLDEVIKKCNVDTKYWEVADFSAKELASGEFLWTVYFKKRAAAEIDFNQFKEELKKVAPKTPKINYNNKESGLLLQVSIFDAHIGKLCWAAECGEPYDLKIATKLFHQAIDHTIQQAKKFKIEEVVFVIGSDYLHVDSKNNTTTHNTPQDCDSRSTKMFVTARKLLVDSIEKLKTLAPVRVVNVVGNHDENSMFHLADSIESRYFNDQNVTVDNAPTQRKYMKWGKTLLAWTHGDKEKISDLPLIMAREKQKEWGECKYFYWGIGHRHTNKLYIDEKAGVQIETLPSISGHDAWHVSKGFIGNIRGAVSNIYSKENGLIGKICFNL